MSHNWPVDGHDWVVEYLRRCMANNRIRHAYLIRGTKALGKMTLARAFAMALNCRHDDPDQRPCGECRICKTIKSGNHPDVLYSQTDPNTGVLKIDAIRAVTNQIAMRPYQARYRVAIFDDFDHAQPRAQDALLKTLEEPPSYAVLILLAESLESILATITSRSQMIRLRPVSAQFIRTLLQERFGLELVEATLLSGLSGGRIGWAIDAASRPEMLETRTEALDLLESAIQMNRAERFHLAQNLSKDKSALDRLLELWQTYWRDVLLKTENTDIRLTNADRQVQIEQLVYQIKTDDALKALWATRDLLGQLNLNVNTRLALEVMLLDYPGLSR